MENDIRHFLTKATEEEDCEALLSAYHLMKNLPQHIAPELYVDCAEAALELHCLEISTLCLDKYLEGNPQTNELLCRAYLCQGRLKSPPAYGNREAFEQAIEYFLKAIEIAENEPGCNFLVFNASVLYFHTVHPLLLPGRCRHLVPSLEKVVQTLEQIPNQDHSWRAELTLHLIECLLDSGKKREAAEIAKDAEDFIKAHAPHLFSRLFKLQVQHSLTDSFTINRTIKEDTTSAVIYKIQELKKLEKGANLTKDDSAKLEDIFSLLVGGTKTSTVLPIQPADRVAFLLELAILSLQAKYQNVAANCLKELKSVGEASVGQCIVMKCVKAELHLLKKEANIIDYSKASVEHRLKDIGKLDQLLQSAVKEGDPQAVQAVCATQWKFCLPLLQYTLRKYLQTPLLRVAQELEEIKSSLLEMRCQIHSELAKITEEEGCLESSLTQLQKAIKLDNGTRREQLSSALHLLQVRRTPFQALSQNIDKAAMLLHQTRGKQPHNSDIRPTLVAVGLHLGQDEFQMVLDGDNISKIPVGLRGSGPLAQLSARAKHHSASLQSVDEYLARQTRGADCTERMKLWASLAKTARKHEIWDVCRGACRFSLFYDKRRRTSKDKSGEECLNDCNSRSVTDCLRILAETYFISAEATIQKLLSEGVQLNSPAVLPQKSGFRSENPHWLIYSKWVQDLSAHATSHFMRAAELGMEIMEPWVVTNAAIYLWNYSSNVLVAGEYQHLLPSFQSLLEMLQKLECPMNCGLVVLLCNAVAQGLMKSVRGPEGEEPNLTTSEGKSSSVKRTKHAVALQDMYRALELCDYALQLSNCNMPGEMVSIAAKKQLVATWVRIKLILQQQIDLKNNFKDERMNEEVLMRVLVAVEIHQCNRTPRQIEFSAPNLSTLVSMASECSWTDAVVELHVWCQLASLCYTAKNHGLVSHCAVSALQLEEKAEKLINTLPCVLYDLIAINEMLSSAACARGLSLVHESKGDLQTYREAMKFILSSISYAAKANNPELCLTAARHYWNTCLPLIQTPAERGSLKDPLEKILTALFHTTTKHTQEKEVKGKESLILTGLYFGSTKQEVTNEEGRTLRAAIYSLLLHIYIDESDRKSALQLLDKAINNIPSTRQARPLLKHCIKLKARLGESVLMDMQRLWDDEQSSSLLWHQLALCAGSMTHKVTYYKKSISSLFSTETQWQKVDLILEFGHWLYFHNFPEASAQHQVQWAIDILLHLDPEPDPEPDSEVDPELDPELDPEQDPKQASTQSSLSTQDISLTGVQSLYRQNMSSLNEVRRLDGLVRAHTLLAVMAGRTSPEHQLNLLIAYTFVLQIWQVSLDAASALLQPSPPPPKKKNVKGKTPQDKKAVVINMSPPSCPEDWAKYFCPDQVRDIFKDNSNPQCINTHSILNQTQSIFYLNLLGKELHSISLDHLTLPVLHLAELIAHDLTDKRSLSDLCRLKILWTCYQLGLEPHSQYQSILQNLCETKDEEQIECHTAIALSNNGGDLHKPCNHKAERDDDAWPGQQSMNVFAQDIWLDKAEVCLSMGLYQPARQLLAETHLVARELGNQKALARSLLGLATLACEEQKPAQALTILNKTQDLSGDEEFWYQFTLIKVRASVGCQDTQTAVDHTIKQGCGALELVMEQQINRAPEITFLITSLEMRGAKECIGALDREPGTTLCYDNVQRVTAACSTLRECVSSFTKLNHRQQAAEASADCAHGMRLLAKRAIGKEEKQRFLLAGLSQMQQSVALQEHAVLNARSLLSQQKTCEFSVKAIWRLMHLRLALAEFSLAMLEEMCAEETRQALSRQRKTSTEIILEAFLTSALEPSPIEQEWMKVSSTLGQVVLCQLGAISSHSFNNMEIQAHCLSLTGKYLRLQAVQMDPSYVCDLWDKRKQDEALSDHEAISVQSENSENGKDLESNPKDLKTTAKSTELKERTHKTKQLLAQATKALSEAISLCLQHNQSSSILADASINILGCLGQVEPAMAGQYLALFQSCCTVSVAAEVLSSACVDTNESQLSALYSLHKNLLHYQGKRPSSMLKGLEHSLKNLSKAFNQLTINPDHFNILKELPPNLNILLLQHSADGSELYGAFYEMNKTSENKGKTIGVSDTLTCSNVAMVPVCPQDLLTLREQVQTFAQDTRSSLIKEVCLHSTKGNLEAFEKNQKTATDKSLTPHFCKIVGDMEKYLQPLLTQFDFSCLRPQVEDESPVEQTKSKDKKKKQNLPPGEYVVLLADRKLLDLPLESLPFLQEEGLISVSRDLSLQLLHSRLNKVKPPENNDKKSKSGKKGKKEKKQDQNTTAIPEMPSNTFSADIRNLKYIADSYGDDFETSLTMKMVEIMDTHSKLSKLQKDEFMGSLSQLEQILCKCSAFIYLGREHFMANISPGKLAALALSKCRMALLFEQVHNDATSLRQSVQDTQRNAGPCPLLKPLETALLLSLGGVGCVIVNQWQSSFQQTANNMVSVLDNLVRVRQTSGQTVHALRRDGSKMAHMATESHDPVHLTDSKKVEAPQKIPLKPSSFNCILYGLPYVAFS